MKDIVDTGFVADTNEDATAGSVTQSRYLSATLTESPDAPSGFSGNPTISVGDRFNGSLSTSSDVDVVRITLTAGQGYTFTAFGRGGQSAAANDVVLTVYDSNGNIVAYNDDIEGVYNRFAGVTFTARTSGTYYVEVSGFDSGAYTLQTATNVYTVDQVVSQLAEFGWGIPTPIAHNVSAGGVITVNITALTAEGQQLARWALEAWSIATGITFREVSSGGEIVFDDNQPGASAGPSAYDPNTGEIVTASVNISTDWLRSNGTSIDSYSFQTYLHEIGHALGLGHAGPYDGSARYPDNALYRNDSYQMTVMSYFTMVDNTFINGTSGSVVTPMIADYAAVHSLYGTPAIYAGNTVWGAGNNLGGYMGRLMRIIFGEEAPDPSFYDGEPIIFTIVDTSGNDTINLTGLTTANRIDINIGAASDFNGGRGNMVIGQNTVIENVIGGSGNDTITGNSAANTLTGGLGNDRIDGGGGSDTAVINATRASVTVSVAGAAVTISSSQGVDTYTNVEYFQFSDGTVSLATLTGVGGPAPINGTSRDETLVGGSDDDLIYGGGGNDRLDGLVGNDTIYGGADNDAILGREGNDSLFGDDGDDNIAAADGADTVYGGLGHDSLGGGNGNDRMYGGLGNDTIGSGSQDDLIDAGDGNDIASGGWGVDTVYGGAGDDELAGSYNNDTIYGGDGSDNIGGGTGTDYIYAGTGHDSVGAGDNDDFIFGGLGDDFLAGGAGNDQIFGEDGNDRLNAGTGNDTLTGGAGADRFIFNSFTRGEVDRVTDWVNGVDRFQLHGVAGSGGAGKFAALSITSTVGGVNIRYDGHTIFVEGASVGQFDASDFIFVG